MPAALFRRGDVLEFEDGSTGVVADAFLLNTTRTYVIETDEGSFWSSESDLV